MEANLTSGTLFEIEINTMEDTQNNSGVCIHLKFHALCAYITSVCFSSNYTCDSFNPFKAKWFKICLAAAYINIETTFHPECVHMCFVWESK
jgi:hypothetical protein